MGREGDRTIMSASNYKHNSSPSHTHTLFFMLEYVSPFSFICTEAVTLFPLSRVCFALKALNVHSDSLFVCQLIHGHQGPFHLHLHPSVHLPHSAPTPWAGEMENAQWGAGGVRSPRYPET
eukprot:TRINITY_DN105302_c2_g1_i1.p1 TRINITY_DN105302_c2_g1~~TRINITY_DN105302_c2_g1_i1.p1  ORF type:complete len:137 (+),score=6.60 TRINITY_DN105302_c2_g1_i1:51-413(+)